MDQDIMIDGGEKLPHIQRQNIFVFSQKVGASIQRSMSALSNAVCIGIKNKFSFKYRLNDIDERVMHHAVSEWCR